MTDVYQKAFEHIWDLFLIPEINRRQERGEIKPPIIIKKAQILFFPDNRQPEIRINEQTNIKAKIKLRDGVVLNVGDTVYEDAIENIEEITLPENENKDCGHATLIKFKDKWFFEFDFIYNKALSNRHISNASQFIDAAEYSLMKNNISVFIDNLYSAAELLAKAFLLCFNPNVNLRSKGNHKAILTHYNLFAHLKNVKNEYADALNQLSKLRYPARYIEGEYSISKEKSIHLLNTIKEMFEETRKNVPPL